MQDGQDVAAALPSAVRAMGFGRGAVESIASCARRRSLRLAALLTSTALVALAQPAMAQQVWTGISSTDYGTAANWSNPATVPDPSATAVFTNNGAPISVTVSGNFGVGGFTFDADVPYYTISLAPAASLAMLGAGIVNNSGIPQIFEVGSAGAQLDFRGTSTAGNASFNVASGGAMLFSENASGGTAQIINNGILYLRTDIGTVEIGSLSGGGTVAAFKGTTGTVQTLNIGSLNRSTTFSGTMVDGDAPLVVGKVGTGTLTLTGQNTYSGGTIISSGTLQIGNGGTSGSIAGNVANSATLAFNRSDATTFGGVVFGSGNLVKLGAGTLTLTGSNSYLGGTTISDGTLQIGNGGTTGSITGDVTNNAALVFNRSDAIGFGGVISGTGSVTKLGAEALTLTGANTYTGGTTISDGALQIGNGGTTGSITGDVTNNAALVFNRSDAIGFGGAISGSGSVTKLGADTLTLTGANTYTGGTTISNGTLQIGNGGTTGSIIGDVTNNAALVFNRSDAIGFGGVISGSGNLVKQGAGTLTLTGSNSYTGGTTISAGTLQIGNGGTTGSISGDVTNNATLAFNRSDAIGFGGLISGSGNLVKQGAGTLMLTGSNSYTGGTTISAGTLQIGNGGTTGSISGDVTNNATLAFNRSDAIGFGGLISGSGNLVKQGAGTLTLTGANSYTGGTTISAGTLQIGNGGSSGSIVGDVTNNATLAFNRSDAIGFGGLISGSGNLVKQGAGTLTLTGGNSYTGGTTISAGTLQIGNGGTTGSISGDVFNNGTLAFNRGDATSFGGAVSGAGSLIKRGAGNLTLTGTSSYTGATTLEDGTLSVNGSIASSSLTTVNAGAALGGNGTVGTTLINGGALAPGNSIGTLSVTGNLTFTAASSYMVEVSPTSADRVNVSGTATLGGATVNASFANGGYVDRQYTIVNATGGVVGTFGTLVNTNLPSGFKSSLGYDSNNAYLNLVLDYTPTPPTPPGPPTPPIINSGLNANQTQVANALSSYFAREGSIPIVFGALTPAGLSIASGETPTGAQQATFNAMNMFMGVLTEPFSNGRGLVDPSPGAMSYAAGAAGRGGAVRDAQAMIAKAGVAAPFESRWVSWGAVFGGAQTTDGNASLGSATSTSRLYGLAAGADYWLSPQTVAGFAMAGGATQFGLANGLGSGRSDLVQVGGFIRHSVGAGYLTAAAAYGWQDITTDRTVALGGFNQLRAGFNANAYSARVEAGHRWVAPFAGGIGLTPYAAGQVTAFDLPAYAEQAVSGTGVFALGYDARTATSTRSELGLRADKSFAIAGALLTLRGRAAWAHEFDIDRSVAATFQALPGASFVVSGARPARDAALTTVSADVNWMNGFSVGASFEGEFSAVTRSYAGKGVVRYAW
ncbi:autotransporter-associated beta strand repeat-containing protein [Rhodopseudomonas sp. HC1]|uniref:autotransporter outer membrane beta-barrel domain-containing protein n=1 Tax=Rhodopseudomonas infernalis TaxID=2897386 RepID=UPI001EE962ED|nr:autotransporter-associated beta strand repeat-containing protein [Rhodopseudomonas infernalis]MCG6203708.1 autotransporter-associated beta strand repeat-containing protein [Rhodopseudomonas infernalis]